MSTVVVGYELCRRGFRLEDFGAPQAWFAAVGLPAGGKTTTTSWAQDFTRDFYGRVLPHALPQPWVSLEGSLPGVLQVLSQKQQPDTGTTPAILFHPEVSRVLRNEESAEPLCMLYDGRDYDRNLRYLQKAADAGDPAAHAKIRAPAINAIVTTTPAMFEQVVRTEVLEGGLFSRFLWMKAQVGRDELMPRPLRDEAGRQHALAYWCDWFRWLETNARCRREIRYTAQAREFLETQLFEYLRDYMVRTTYEAGVAIRAMPHASRLAAIFAGSRGNFQDGHLTIDAEDVFCAANMTYRSMQTALAFGAPVAAASSRLPARIERLLLAVQAAGHEGLGRRAVHKLFANNLYAQAVEDLVRILVESGLVHEEEQQPNGRGRPRKILYSVEVWQMRSGAGG